MGWGGGGRGERWNVSFPFLCSSSCTETILLQNKSLAASKTKGKKLRTTCESGPNHVLWPAGVGGDRRSGFRREFWRGCGANIYPVSAPLLKANSGFAAPRLLFQAGKARNASVQTGVWIQRWWQCDAALTFDPKRAKKQNNSKTADSA